MQRCIHYFYERLAIYAVNIVRMIILDIIIKMTLESSA